MVKEKKKRKAIWDKDYTPYGTYEGTARGNEDEWRQAFGQVWNARTGKEFLKEESPWEVLGVRAGSDFETVKAAFYKLIQVVHPDKGGDEETCKRVLAAWAILKEVQGREG